MINCNWNNIIFKPGLGLGNLGHEPWPPLLERGPLMWGPISENKNIYIYIYFFFNMSCTIFPFLRKHKKMIDAKNITNFIV